MAQIILRVENLYSCNASQWFQHNSRKNGVEEAKKDDEYIKLSYLDILPWEEHCVSTLIQWIFLVIFVGILSFGRWKRAGGSLFWVERHEECLKTTFKGGLYWLSVNHYVLADTFFKIWPLQPTTNLSSIIFMIVLQSLFWTLVINSY